MGKFTSVPLGDDASPADTEMQQRLHSLWWRARRRNRAQAARCSDAELIAICATFCDLERAYDAPGFAHETGSPEGDAAEKERERIAAEQDVLADRMCELPCTTLAGVQAMGRALAAWDRELLKDGPAKDLGELLTSHVVARLLALREPGQVVSAPVPILPHPDADLIAACSEFRASEAAFCAIFDDGLGDHDAADEAARMVLAKSISDSWDGMLDRMAQLQATSNEGLAARAIALAQHAGMKPGTDCYPFRFEPEEPNDLPGRLLHMLLTDASRMIGGPLPVLDADLLALRPEFDRLHALMIDYNTPGLIPDDGTECADFDVLCARIATAAPAVTAEGRAFQAAAVMHHLTYRLSDCDEQARNPAWIMLKGIAGDAYQSVEGRR